MKVTMIGTGYVGLVSGTCFAEIGHEVTCVDIDPKKIEILKQGESPIYEPGLSDLLKRNIKAKRLDFATDFKSVEQADCVFLAVGTPSGDDGSANLDYLFKATADIAPYLQENAVVVVKSTVPIGTGKRVKEFLQEKTSKKFHLVNNPEFLKEGSAVEDFMRPDRVVIGCETEEAVKMMEELYAPLVRQGNPIYSMSNISAEMTKYAANSFLATKISFINEIARLCDRVGADINEVRKGISSDQRIGKHFLYPGPGYGGSCFPKDVKALIYSANQLGEKMEIIESTERVNERQKEYMAEKIKHFFDHQLSDKTFCLWGAAFKANTDDVRESSSLNMVRSLALAGAKIHLFDPEACPNFLRELPPDLRDQVQVFEDKYEALKSADGLVVMTEWREFQNPDYARIKTLLKRPIVFDARNLFETEKVLKAGFTYFAIGKFIPVS